MKKICILLICLPFVIHADTLVSAPINTDTTWTAALGPYLIDSNFNVASGTTLTIEAGTIIKGRVNNSSVPSIYGTLIAHGTAEAPIYFTSINDDSLGGDSLGDGTTTPAVRNWQGLYFRPGSHGNLSYVTLAYAGYGDNGFGDDVGIENDGGELNIDHSIIHDNYTIGVLNKGLLTISDSDIENDAVGIDIVSGTTTISNTIISNNSRLGISHNTSDSITLTHNTFLNNKTAAEILASAGFIHSGNTASGGTINAFEIGGEVKDGAVWSPDTMPIVAGVEIPADATLTIEPGSIIKMLDSGSINVAGRLIAEGTSGSKIYFTSLKDDSLGGDTNGDGSATHPAVQDWSGIVFRPGSEGSLKQVDVQYGGHRFLIGISAVIYNLGGDISIGNSLIEKNSTAGFYQDAGSTTISHTEFASQAFGIHSRGGSLTLLGNTFLNHGSYAIFNETNLDRSGVNVRPIETIDARNSWWGSNTGPNDLSTSTPTGIGDHIGPDVLYNPWLRRDPSLPNPVIIVPGIMGSELVNSNLVINNELWPSLVQMVLPGDDVYLEQLNLNTLGQSMGNISPSHIFMGVSNFDFFNGLFGSLFSGAYVLNQSLFEYPYDWRVDVQTSSAKLKEKIDLVKIQTGATKIDLIAHSMGGLLVKEYLKDNGGDSIGRFIDIGTPQSGAPKAFKALSYGDNFGFEKFGLSILSPERAKSMSQNMPSVYELLPSQNYFDSSDPNYKYYVFDGINNNTRFDFNQTKDYLKASGRNSSLVERADTFHQEIDNLNPADYGVQTYNIVGCGTPTIGQIYILDKNGDHYNYNIKMINGDGTVPLKSAEAMPALKTYFVKNAQHATLPSTSGVKELVTSILKGDENSDISPFPNLSTSEADCSMPNGKLVSFHSPIDLNIYDASGNHVGPDANGDIENNIPGVEYEIIDDNKFAFLPDGQSYEVKGKATGSGTFDARIETVINGEVLGTTLFNDVSISPTTQVQFAVGQQVPTQIALDQNGDGVFESDQNISTTTAGFIESTGKQKPTTVIQNTSAVSGVGGSGGGGSSLARKQIVLASIQVAKNVKPVPALKINKPVVTSVVSLSKAKSTAAVYNAISNSIKNAVKSLWSWLKSKL